MKLFKQYKNLSKEIYVLFFGRIVTSMGALIWPLLTLIMKNKLGYSATFIAFIDVIMLMLQFPMILIGGKLADHKNRKAMTCYSHDFSTTKQFQSIGNPMIKKCISRVHHALNT